MINKKRKLVFIQDRNNVVGYDVLSHIKDKCLTKISYVAFWKIRGNQGELEFKDDQNRIIGMKYLPLIDRVCILCTKGIYSINPEANIIGKNIADKHHCLLGPYCFTESELFVFGAPSDKTRHKYILARLNLLNKTYDSVDFNEFITRLCSSQKGILYAVIDGTSIYKISQDLKTYSEIKPQIQINSKGPIDIWGSWPEDDSLIISYSISDTEEIIHRISWGQVAIDLNSQIIRAFRVGEYLWTIDSEIVRLYDREGKLCREHYLHKKVLSFAPMNEKGSWVFYTDGSIDILDNQGDKIETMTIDIQI